jgi:hypothetical protein
LASGFRAARRRLTAEGDSVPEPVLPSGKTNSRSKFSIGAKAFLNE